MYNLFFHPSRVLLIICTYQINHKLDKFQYVLKTRMMQSKGTSFQYSKSRITKPIHSILHKQTIQRHISFKKIYYKSAMN